MLSLVVVNQSYQRGKGEPYHASSHYFSQVVVIDIRGSKFNRSTLIAVLYAVRHETPIAG